MNRKVLTIISCILVLSLLLAQTVFADTRSAGSGGTTEQVDRVLLDDLLKDLSDADISAYQSFGEELADALRDADDTYSNDDIVESFFRNHCNPIYSHLLDSLSDHADADMIELEQSSEIRLIECYDVDDNTLLHITPTYLCIDQLITTDEEPQEPLRTSSKSGECLKTYYGLNGNMLFKVWVGCSFYYNGSSAWFKSGFYKDYTPGTLAVWQVHNWDGNHYTVGTSYRAYCSGLFKWGFNYSDIGLVVQTYDVYNYVQCSASGLLSQHSNNY